VAGVFVGVAEEGRVNTELWNEAYSLKITRTPSIDLRKELNWVPLVRRREMFQLFLVHILDVSQEELLEA